MLDWETELELPGGVHRRGDASVAIGGGGVDGGNLEEKGEGTSLGI